MLWLSWKQYPTQIKDLFGPGKLVWFKDLIELNDAQVCGIIKALIFVFYD